MGVGSKNVLILHIPKILSTLWILHRYSYLILLWMSFVGRKRASRECFYIASHIHPSHSHTMLLDFIWSTYDMMAIKINVIVTFCSPQVLCRSITWMYNIKMSLFRSIIASRTHSHRFTHKILSINLWLQHRSGEPLTISNWNENKWTQNCI